MNAFSDFIPCRWSGCAVRSPVAVFKSGRHAEKTSWLSRTISVSVYATLVSHLANTLQELSSQRARELLRSSPKRSNGP